MHGLLVQWDPTASFDLNSAIDYYEGIRERNAKFADQFLGVQVDLQKQYHQVLK